MPETYTLRVAGLERELPICKVNDHMDIAAFIMFGDVELTVACARELLAKCPEFDVILTAEAKGIPLAYEMARQSGKPWLTARKGVKLYMSEPVVIEDESITTAGKQTLVIDKKDITSMDGKRILIVDDVISHRRFPSMRWRRWRPAAPAVWWAAVPLWQRAMQPVAPTFSSWHLCRCFSINP